MQIERNKSASWQPRPEISRINLCTSHFTISRQPEEVDKVTCHLSRVRMIKNIFGLYLVTKSNLYIPSHISLTSSVLIMTS